MSRLPTDASGLPDFDLANIPDFTDADTRERLSPASVAAIRRLADLWSLSNTEACGLLGDVSEATWLQMKAGAWDESLSQDTLTRISALMGIFKGLNSVFSQPLANEWVRLPNSSPLYQGRHPLDIILEGGVPAMLDVRRYIDAIGSGY